MGFVSDPPATAAPASTERRRISIRGPGCLLSQLADSRPLVRRWGVRDLAGYPQAATVLLEHLTRETDEAVREVVLATLGSMPGEIILQGLLAILGSDDANLRNGAMEVLRLRAVEVLPLLLPLLDHPRRELRAAGVEILQAAPPRLGRELLLRCLEQEQDVRVMAMIITALAKQGLAGDARRLQEASRRFEGQPFLRFATTAAIQRLTLPAEPLQQETIHLSDEAWSLFQELLQTTTGRQLAPATRDESEEVILQVARQRGFAHMGAFLDDLALPEARPTWHLLLDRLFPLPRDLFHASDQLRCLVGPVMEEVLRIRPRGGKVRLWCHSVSEGSEPYSLAMALAEYSPYFAHTPFQLVASEEDGEALARARQGFFARERTDDLPGEVMDRHGEEDENGVTIRETLRQQIAFHVMDLDDPVAGKRFREFDVILCRDLLCRRDSLARRRAATLFFDALNPGGFLMLGPGETMSSISGMFRVRGFFGYLVFQKPLV